MRAILSMVGIAGVGTVMVGRSRRRRSRGCDHDVQPLHDGGIVHREIGFAHREVRDPRPEQAEGQHHRQPVDERPQVVALDGRCELLVVEGLDYEQSSNIEVTVNRVDAAGGVGPDSNLSPISSLKWTNNVGHALIRHVDLEIGGARINA